MGICASLAPNSNSSSGRNNAEYGRYCRVKNLDELNKKLGKKDLLTVVDWIYEHFDANHDDFLYAEEIRAVLKVVLRRDSVSDADVQALVRLSKSSQAGRIHKSDFANIYQAWQALNDKAQVTQR